MALRRRLIRFLVTALRADFLEVIKPNFKCSSEGLGRVAITKFRVAIERPCFLTAENSSLRVMLSRRGTRIIQGIFPPRKAQTSPALLTVLHSMPLVGDLCPLGKETLSPFLPATLENTTTCFGRHPSPKTVLTLPDAFGGLVCALAHGFKAFSGTANAGGTRRLAGVLHLSIHQRTFLPHRSRKRSTPIRSPSKAHDSYTNPARPPVFFGSNISQLLL